jgi:pilus assembly protein TadC
MSVNGLQIALLGGLLLGAGVAGVVWRLLPAHADAADVLARLAPAKPGSRDDHETAGDALNDRLGRWAWKTMPAALLGRPPAQDLALLRISVARFFGDKIIFAVLGLVIPPMLTLLLTLLGWSPPFLLPVGGTLVLAAVMFMVPNYNVADDAKRARSEFARALGAYADLVALERNGGSGPRQALEVAAGVGDSWVFRRIREELAFSNWSGEPPWEALRRLSTELGVTELTDLADIVRLSGEEGAQIYAQLRARSAAMRSAMLHAELARANEIGEKLSIPMSVLGVVFLVILIAPALLRVTGGS